MYNLFVSMAGMCGEFNRFCYSAFMAMIVSIGTVDKNNEINGRRHGYLLYLKL